MRPSLRRTPLFLVLAAQAACTSSPPGEVDVPLTVTGTATDGPYMTVEVQIGDAPAIPAFVDTGSSGLRVIAGAVPASALTSMTTVPISNEFHSGVIVAGVVATATVSVGGASTGTPIPIEWVNSVSCSAKQPSCFAAKDTLATFSFTGHLLTTHAILGLAMSPEVPDAGPSFTVGDPIAQMPGHPMFVVKAPPFGPFPSTGTLVIRPSETSGYSFYQLESRAGSLANGTPSWDDFGVPSCITNGTIPALSYCSKSVFDTGGALTQIELPRAPVLDGGAGEPDAAGSNIVADGGFPSIKWAPGADVSIVVGPTTAPIATYAFTISSSPEDGLDAVITEPSYSSRSLINLGTMAFFRYDILFDHYDGRIGLAAK